MTDDRDPRDRRPAGSRPRTRPGVETTWARRPMTPAERLASRRPVRQPRRRRTQRLGRPQLRIRASLAVTVVALALLGGRMVWLQGLQSASYSARATAERLNTQTLHAARGAIEDRWGHVLSDDLSLRLIFADPTLEKTPQATAAKLAPILHLDEATLLADITRPKTRYVVLAKEQPVSVSEEVAALGDPAIASQAETKRDHPDGDLAGALVGLTGTDTHGLSGVEELMDSTLSGSDGKEEQEIDPSGVAIPGGTLVDTPAVDGSNVRLTIDRDLQYEAQQALDAQVAASGATGGQVIVMDPKSGQVLALASAPEYDPTKPLKNAALLTIPALQTPYEPGSVNKLITASAAIDTGKMTPTSALTIPSSLPWPGRSNIIDAENHGTENLTLTGVLAQSSNIGIDLTSEVVGKETVYAYLKKFGLGSLSGIGYPGETQGVLPNVADWNSAQASTIPFGQGVSASALQIIDAYAAIANGGVRVSPSIIRETVSPDGTVHPYAGGTSTRVVSKATAATVARMLEAVTTSGGTAPKAQIAGYNVAGKTGTANAVVNGAYDNSSFVDSFVGFAPADNPRLVVEVVIDHPTKGSHFGGDTAAPVFSQVMGFGLREFDVPPTGKKADVPALCWGSGYCPVAAQ